MDSREALRLGIDMGSYVGMAYLEDLSDEELMMRPTPGCNHIKWQLGHLITAEHHMMEQVAPGSMPALPEGFAARYTKEKATSDSPEEFSSKDELYRTFQEQREATLNTLAGMSDEQLDGEAPESLRQFVPTVAAMFSLQGSHWLMHAGQWVIVRRQLGRPPLF